MPGSPQTISPVATSTGLAVEGHRLAVGLHAQLLQVGGEAGQVLRVRQHGGVCAPKKSMYQTEIRPEQRRQVLLVRRRPEVLVDGVEPVEHLAVVRRADRDHQRQADGRREGVPAADPVPEAEHVRGVDAERGDLLGVGGDGDEVLGDRRLVAAQPVEQPAAGLRGVGQRLLGGEGLRRDDEQRAGRVEVAGGLGQVGRVDVGDEPEGQRPVGVVAQRQVGHRRAEVGAADADVDDGPDPLAGVPGPRAAAHPVGEVGHPAEHLLDVVPHVLAVDLEAAAAPGRAARRAGRRGPRSC